MVLFCHNKKHYFYLPDSQYQNVSSNAPPSEPPDNDRFVETERLKRMLFQYDEIKRVFDNENSTANTISTLQGQLIGWSGLIISIIFAGGGVLFNKEQGSIAFEPHEFVILFMALVSLLAAIIIGVINMTTARFRLEHLGSVHSVVPDPVELIRLGRQQHYEEMILPLIHAMSIAVYDNLTANNRRDRFRIVSSYLFLLGLIFAVIFISLQLYRFVR